MLLFFTAFLVVVLDQLTKTWVRSYSLGQVIYKEGFFSIVHSANTGAVFGILQDKSFFLTIVAFIGIILILFYAFVIAHRSPFFIGWPGSLALGLVLGGAVGNLTDRLRYGHVTDFISVSIWPTFNIADSSLTIGVILFAYLFLTSAAKPEPSGTEEAADKQPDSL